MESTFSSEKISFDIDIIKNIFLEEFKENQTMFRKRFDTIFKKEEYNPLFNLNDSFYKDKSLTKDFNNEKEVGRDSQSWEEIRFFNSKYLADITIKSLEEKKQKFENEKNENMKEYIQYQIDESKNINEEENEKEKADILNNQKFINNLFSCKHSEQLFSIYIISFLKAIDLINSLFKNLITNTHLLPYSIKVICKIIFILIKKKFPNINKVQQFAFISKFFFNKLFLPILKNPSFGALINEYIISEETFNNLNAISDIISHLCSGKFYFKNEKNGNMNPFNGYFLEKMPDVFQFFEEILKVELPIFVTNLINEKVPEDNHPYYFVNYPDEIIFHRSIFFTFEDFYLIIQNVKKNKDKIFINENSKKIEKIFNKIIQKNYTEIIENIKKEKIYEDINNDIKSKEKMKENNKNKIETIKEIIFYFLITKILINKNYSYLFKMKQEKPYFHIKELKKVISEKEIISNNIIKVKNFICQILSNYRLLKKAYFSQDNIIDTFNIFKELKKFIKSPDFVIDESIPNEWYVDTLLEYINKIPDKFKINDYNLLYEEIKQEVNNSIKSLSFEIFGSFLDKIKYAQKNKTIYQKIENGLIDISLNEKVQDILEFSQIPCELYFSYSEKEKRLYIKEFKKDDKTINFLDSMIFKESKKNNKICKTIKSFVKYFPNIVKNYSRKNTKIFEMLKQMDIPKVIEKYLNIIKLNLYKSIIWKAEDEFNNINNKIYDFVTAKIYDKIYPLKSSKEDIEIYENCLKLSWTEAQHYLKDKSNYAFDSFLPNIIDDFNLLHKEKSPRKKIIIMKNIFNCIKNLVKLNGENEQNLGIDRQISILNYSFVKAQPKNIETDCNYIELFIEKDGENDNLLAQLKLSKNFVKEIKYNSLIGVKKEEFDKKFKINTGEV